MEHLTFFIMGFIWLLTLIICFEGIFNIIMTWYYDYKNNKKLEQLKKELKLK